ncbi:hypothetical protein SETIT_1G170400v2 [Setaria italica]|uniref:Alpha-1,4 glucan phosphorylase n=2 Tax=Setaria TaxID=4554 RepID=A0A368PNE4_SETIT|nr:alpha-glucan phosphorylase, H isozyme-like [Setaria viridis]RCV06530.1 hypothetical protein SETIT_1G170400v2 [Setaria italica]TKW39344.1 hypothetical protein SEVIR_1G173100v2 [Setaria viridis]
MGTSSRRALAGGRSGGDPGGCGWGAPGGAGSPSSQPRSGLELRAARGGGAQAPGGALTNAVGNLGITGAYAEAVKKFGYELEALAGQEKDAALGNGGLGRLASCLLDSMATLNWPAWGYGLRYRYGLFKQHIAKEGQEEIAED